MAHYQKPYSLGKTNVEQRWKDVIDCGGTFGDKHIKDIWQRQVFSDKGGNPKDTFILMSAAERTLKPIKVSAMSKKQTEG